MIYHYATITIIVALQIARDFELEINVGVVEIKIQYGGGRDDS